MHSLSSVFENPDLQIFTSLGYGVFSIKSESELKLLNPPVAWLNEYFSGCWDNEEKVLSLEPHSVIGSFLEYCLDAFETGQTIEDQQITFEEKFDDRYFLGQVMAHFSGDELIIIIRKSDDLDTISRDELQMLRKSVLGQSNFERARQNHLRGGVSNFNSKPLDSELLGRSLIESTDQPILVFDRTGELMLANSGAIDLFPSVLSSNRMDAFARDTVSVEEANGVIDRVKTGFSESLWSRWEIGVPIQCQIKVMVSPIVDDAGVYYGSIWTFDKVCKGGHSLANPIVTEAERLEAVGRLAGGVAHDFNNLLAIVIGNLSLLTNHAQIQTDKNYQQPVDMAMEASNKAAVLVKQLLGYSRRTRLEKEAVSIADLIREAADLFVSKLAEDLAFTLSIDVDDATWMVEADREQLLQVLLNVFENSLHACDGRGSIRISARNYMLTDASMADALDCSEGHYVILTSADNGCGMSEETKDKVFEPFFTTKDVGEGTGLGMANALGIVRQHGGHISCTSAIGQGTSFNLYLPRSQRNRQIAKLHSVETNRLDLGDKGDAPVILVVDDEELLRNLVRTLCEKNGYRTIGAGDGVEALEMVAEHQDQIMAIVLDLAMPRMDGKEFFTELNRLEIAIPVIVASGFLVDVDEFIEETNGTPFSVFSKPYQLSDLIGKIGEIKEASGLSLPS